MTKPLQVYLDDGELGRLEAWAHARGWTKSQAVRVAIRALTRTAGTDPLLELSGLLDGLPADASERFDHYLLGTYVAERRGRYGGKPGRRRAATARR